MTPASTGAEKRKLTILQKGRVYLAPSGRRCMLAPEMKAKDTEGSSFATLVYHRADGSPGRNSADDSFTLTEANFGLLRSIA